MPPDPETLAEWQAFDQRFPEESWRFKPTEGNMDLIEEPPLIERPAQRRLLYTLGRDARFRAELQEALGIEAGS